MATVPTGYVFWDVSAKKSYAAGATMPALGNGDYLVPASTGADGYYQQYIYHSSFTYGGITLTNCWDGVIQTAYTSYAQKLPFNSLGDKPVRFFRYPSCQFTACPTKDNAGNTSSLSAISNLRYVAFDGCTKMTSAPVLPTGLTSLYSAFYNTKIAAPPSNFASLASLVIADYCFYNTPISSAPAISGLHNLTSLVGMFSNCKSLVTPPEMPDEALDTGYMFLNCTALTLPSTPYKLKSNLTSIYAMFDGCTSIAGFIRFECENNANSTYTFRNTRATNQIILLSPASAYSKASAAAKSGNNGNVYAGIIATPASFTAIRGDYDPINQTFEEKVSGEYCKLTVNYTAPYVQDALLLIPDLTSEGNPVSVTWHIGTLSGAVLTSAGTQVLSTGTLVAVISLGSSETAASYSLRLHTWFTYNEIEYGWHSGTVAAILTYSNALIDVNPTGIGMAFFGEVPNDFAGLLVKKEATFENPITAEDTITTEDVVIADDFYLELDENAASGDDYEIIQALTALGWTDCLIND